MLLFLIGKAELVHGTNVTELGNVRDLLSECETVGRLVEECVSLNREISSLETQLKGTKSARGLNSLATEGEKSLDALNADLRKINDQM